MHPSYDYRPLPSIMPSAENAIVMLRRYFRNPAIDLCNVAGNVLERYDQSFYNKKIKQNGGANAWKLVPVFV